MLCYKQITSIGNFRKRCARVNEIFKKRCEQRVATETISERKELNTQTECIPFVELSAGQPVTPSNSVWTKDDNYGDTSGQLLSNKFFKATQVSTPLCSLVFARFRNAVT